MLLAFVLNAVFSDTMDGIGPLLPNAGLNPVILFNCSLAGMPVLAQSSLEGRLMVIFLTLWVQLPGISSGVVSE